MHPVVRASVLVAVWTAVGSLDRGPVAPGPVVVPPAKARGVDGLPALCGPGSLPEGDVCLPIPDPSRLGDVGSTGTPLTNEHPSFRRQGGRETYQQIPRLPERNASWSSYALPVGEPGKAPRVLSDYDLDRPAAEQRHGPGYKAYGHGGVDLDAPRGAPVRLVRLDHQEGDAEVVFVGELFGTTVATAHTVREKDRLRTFLLFHGHLERADPAITVHGRVTDGATLGRVGDTGSPGIVHLHLEARQVRDGVDVTKADTKKLADAAVSIPTDPRNVLSSLK